MCVGEGGGGGKPFLREKVRQDPPVTSILVVDETTMKLTDQKKDRMSSKGGYVGDD